MFLQSTFVLINLWLILKFQINAVAATSNFVRHLSQNSSNSSSGATFSGWSWYKEPVGISSSNAVVLTGLVEQINTTADKTDYLWYSTNLNLNNYDPILRDDSQILLHVDSLGHVLYAYVNGNLIGDITIIIIITIVILLKIAANLVIRFLNSVFRHSDHAQEAEKEARRTIKCRLKFLWTSNQEIIA